MTSEQSSGGLDPELALYINYLGVVVGFAAIMLTSVGRGGPVAVVSGLFAIIMGFLNINDFIKEVEAGV